MRNIWSSTLLRFWGWPYFVETWCVKVERNVTSDVADSNLVSCMPLRRSLHLHDCQVLSITFSWAQVADIFSRSINYPWLNIGLRDLWLWWKNLFPWLSLSCFYSLSLTEKLKGLHLVLVERLQSQVLVGLFVWHWKWMRQVCTLTLCLYCIVLQHPLRLLLKVNWSVMYHLLYLLQHSHLCVPAISNLLPHWFHSFWKTLRLKLFSCLVYLILKCPCTHWI